MGNGDHEQEALWFARVDDPWESSYLNRWIRGVRNVGVLEVSGLLMVNSWGTVWERHG